MMIALATVALTILYPGIAFGKDSHIPVQGVKIGKKKGIDEQYELKDENDHTESNEQYEETNINSQGIYQLEKTSSTDRSIV